jgi:hypothetical protein
MKINTTPGETYIVLSTGGCTVTTGAGKQIKKLAAGQDFFTAMTGDSILSDDNASVTVAKGEILSMLNTDGTGAEVQATLRFQPVTSQSALPATGENGVIYLVPNGADAPNQYTEWVWTGAAYEQLGDVGVDLSGYASKKDLGITTIVEEDSGPVIISNAMLSTQRVHVSTLEVGGCTFSGSTDGSDVVTTTGSLSAGTLAGDDVVTTGGAVITNYIKVVSDTPTLEYADTTLGAEIRGYNFTDEYGDRQHGMEINAGAVRLTTPSGADPYLDVPIIRTTSIRSLAGDYGEFMVGNSMRVGRDFVSLGGYDSWDDKGIKYIHTTDYGSKIDILEIGWSSMLTLGTEGELRCGDGSEGIRIYTNASGIATLHIGSRAEVLGLGGDGASNHVDALYVNTVYPLDFGVLTIDAHVTGIQSLGVGGRIEADCFATNNGYIHLGSMEGGTALPELYLGEGVHITGPGWDETIAQGEPVSTVSTSTVTIRHATWFDNTTQSSIAVQPGTWKNRVMTCYLKTSMPVSLSGVTWIYGEPTMAEGYTYVIALQQLDATTVLANLAYTIPQ